MNRGGKRVWLRFSIGTLMALTLAVASFLGGRISRHAEFVELRNEIESLKVDQTHIPIQATLEKLKLEIEKTNTPFIDMLEDGKPIERLELTPLHAPANSG